MPYQCRECHRQPPCLSAGSLAFLSAVCHLELALGCHGGLLSTRLLPREPVASVASSTGLRRWPPAPIPWGPATRNMDHNHGHLCLHVCTRSYRGDWCIVRSTSGRLRRLVRFALVVAPAVTPWVAARLQMARCRPVSLGCSPSPLLLVAVRFDYAYVAVDNLPHDNCFSRLVQPFSDRPPGARLATGAFLYTVGNVARTYSHPSARPGKKEQDEETGTGSEHHARGYMLDISTSIGIVQHATQRNSRKHNHEGCPSGRRERNILHHNERRMSSPLTKRAWQFLTWLDKATLCHHLAAPQGLAATGRV